LQQRKTFANERKLERTKLVRDEGEFCKPLMLGNKQSVPREQNGLMLVPEVSVRPVVRAIEIMIGRKVFFGRFTSLTATNRIEKPPIKWE